MKKTLARLLPMALLAVALGLSSGGYVMAQEETAATLVGQVTDATGAAVLNATVVVADPTIGFERRVQTNDSGNYIVTPLPPGKYTLTVEQSGFKRYVQTVSLNARDRRQADIVLETGDINETVTVTDDASLIQDSPTGQGLISGNQVVELPLNNRDYLRLSELIPGISSSLDDETSIGLTSRADISINGLRRNSVNYLVDGVTNTDPGSNITLLSTPTVDSIKEFKVLTSNYTAEFGRSAGGVVTVVTRGGSNQFHGSLYEFFRNDYFNANTFFNNAAGRRADGSQVSPVPKLRYNNFGGTFSGPVYLPRFGEGGKPHYSFKNKTFFFFSQETRRIIRGLTDATVTVPNAADRAGNFGPRLTNFLCRSAAGTVSSSTTSACPSGTTPVMATDTLGRSIHVRTNQAFVPGTSTAYADNIVPQSQFDPRAVALLAAFPLPNLGTNSFTVSRINLNNTRQETLRIDHNFNQNNKFFGRYTHDLSQTREPGGLFTGLTLPNIATTDTRVPGQTLALSYTSIISPTVVNEATYNFSGSIIGSMPVGRGRRADYPGSDAIPERFPENNNGAIPSIGISTFSGSLASTQGFRIITRINVIRDNLTWTKNNHTFKFGGEISFEKKAENANNLTQGSFTFSGTQTAGPTALGGTTFTGLGVASFLIGRAASYTEDERDVTFDFRFGRREFFAQDSWRVRPNLTLDLGVRYQYYVPIREENNVLTNFDPRRFNPANAPQCTPPASGPVTCATLVVGTGNPLNGIVVAGNNSRTIVPSDKNNFSPRLGLAWGPFKDAKTVLRLGYGFYYDQVLTGVFGQNTQVNPPFNNRVTFNTSGTTIVSLSNPTGGLAGAVTPRALIATDPNLITPEIQQWSIGVQREILPRMVLDVSYVGTKADHQLRTTDLNSASPARVIAAGGTATINAINAARPFRGYTTITYRESSGRSRYHGMLSSFKYRFTTGSEVSIAYTFSKTLTNSTNDRDAVDIPQDYSLKDREYGVARSNRAHVFSASYVYELPFFKKSANPGARLLLGGWQVSGITQIQSGLPIARVLNSSANNGLRGSYPSVTTNPLGGIAGTLDTAGLPFIFDPTAFAFPADGQFGTAPRAFVRLPMQNQTNLSAIKNFYFDKESRYRVQFRAEVFNVFNHTQFTSAGVTFNPALALNATTFGRPTAARLPREFQFALKFNF